MIQIPSNINGPLCATFVVSYLIFAIIITVYHLITTYNRINDKSAKWKFLRLHPSMFLSYLLLFVAIICGINLSMDLIVGLNNTFFLCQISKHIGPSLYTIYKTILYLILVCRVWKSFKNSDLEYNNKTLICWVLILIMWTICNVIFGNITVKTIVNKNNGVFPKCTIVPHNTYIILIALLDITSVIVNGILFVRPLFKLYKEVDCDINIKYIAIKQCILSMVAVISSILAMIGVALFNGPLIFISSDLFISTLCIILMYKWNSHIFEKIFCCCNCIIPSIQKIENITNLECVTTIETTENTIKSDKSQET